MQNEEACETCGGDGVLIGDKVDRRGERTDDVQPCPDCNTGDDEGDEYESLAEVA